VIVSKEEDNKAIVGRWFTDFWGKTCGWCGDGNPAPCGIRAGEARRSVVARRGLRFAVRP
jgi:hypothetical protein